MLILPAIDLRGGQVVRLRQGDYDRMTVYGDDPCKVAEGFLAAGATQLHVVDLDGAKDGSPMNRGVIAELCKTGLHVEVGGGMRTRQNVEDTLALGVDRIIVGTMAIKNRPLLKELVDECYAKDQFSWRRDVLRAKKDTLKLNSYIWSGFAAQVRSVQEYYDRSMQLLDPKIRADLFAPARPIMAKGADKSSTYVGPDGRCVNSMVAEGCRIEGVVENSILFPGVVVEKGAVVRNCVLFKETAVRENAQLSYIIADKNAEVQAGRTLVGHATYPIVLAKNSVV